MELEIGQKIIPNERARSLVELFGNEFQEKMMLIYDIHHQISRKREKLLEDIRRCHPELTNYDYAYDFEKNAIIITGERRKACLE